MKMLPCLKVTKMVGLDRVTIWRKEKTGEFPSRIVLTVNRLGRNAKVGWLESDILDWIEKNRQVKPKAADPSVNGTQDFQLPSGVTHRTEAV